MTRKDYELIAGSISKLAQGLDREEYLRHYLPVIRELVNDLSTRLEIENPRFNRHIFWKACALD